MGIAFSQLWSKLFNKPEVKILILGLDSAGKSTMLYKITMGEVVVTAPTVGSNVEVYTYKNMRFVMTDVGGQTSLRASWSNYFQATSAVIMVIDSNDPSRLPLAREELHRLCADEALKNALLLVYANKQDLPTAMKPAQVSEGLGLTELRDREWQIMGSSALTGKGLFEGLDWLVTKLSSR